MFGYGGQDIDTIELYKDVSEKFDIYHIIITDPESSGTMYLRRSKESWGKVLDSQHLLVHKSDELPEVIHDIVVGHVDGSVETEAINTVTRTEEGIAW